MKPIMNPDWDTSMLANIYEAWEDREGLEGMPFHERQKDQGSLTEAQNIWLNEFIKAWKAADKREDEIYQK